MFSVTKRFDFSAAHRIVGHEGACKYLHGHNFAAEVTVESATLDPLGMVADFEILKIAVGEWISGNWDHQTLLSRDDPLVEQLDIEHVYTMPGPPTAESMAKIIYEVCSYRLSNAMNLKSGYRMTKVRVYESASCYAEYSPD